MPYHNDGGMTFSPVWSGAGANRTLLKDRTPVQLTPFDDHAMTYGGKYTGCTLTSWGGGNILD